MRCKSCNIILTEMERLSKVTYEDLDGSELSEYDDMCFNCRVVSLTTDTYTSREYSMEYILEGLQSPCGFSDNY